MNKTNLSLTYDTKQMQEALKDVDPRAFRAAHISTLRRIGNACRTEASRNIRRQYNLKQSDVDARMSVTVNPSEGVALLVVKSEPIPLRKFPYTIVEVVGGRKWSTAKGKEAKMMGKRNKKQAGVYVKLKNGTATFIPNAYVIRIGSNVIIKKRVNHKSVEGALITVSTMFTQTAQFEAMRNIVLTRFESTLMHEFNARRNGTVAIRD